jgi:hypothetical protein
VSQALTHRIIFYEVHIVHLPVGGVSYLGGGQIKAKIKGGKKNCACGMSNGGVVLCFGYEGFLPREIPSESLSAAVFIEKDNKK